MKLNISGFLDDIKNFVHGGKALGIDIGTAALKVIEVSKKGDRFQLLNYGLLQTKEYLEHPNRALQSESLLLDEELAANLLKTLLRETGIKTRNALVALPAFSSFVTVLDMPSLSLSETENAVKFQARRVIPLTPNRVLLDWSKVEERENERGQKFQKVLLIGIPTDVIDLYKRIMKKAGIRPIAFELESVSLIRAFTSSQRAIRGSVDPRPTLYIDIGAEATNMCIAEGDTMKYGAQTTHGGLYLTHALQSSLGVSKPRAEELKKRRGLLGQGAELELSTLLLSFLDVIIEEVRTTRASYETRFGKEVAQAVCFGGGAHLLGIGEYFGEQLKLPILKPDIFLDVQYEPGLESAMKYLQREFAVALGSARRYFS
ncbi:MAG: type IV pilus assembly protein PilM [Patescibacteria group bacterium]